LLHRLLEQIAEGGIELAIFLDLRLRHAGVGDGAGAGETRELADARGLDAFADRGGRFAGFVGAQLGERQRGGLDMEIDPVEQGPADPGPVALDLRGRAAALMLRIAGRNPKGSNFGVWGRQRRQRSKRHVSCQQ
jgi:hypothetical protein